MRGHKWERIRETPVWKCTRCGARDYSRKKPAPGKKVLVVVYPKLTCAENIARQVHDA